MDIDLFFHLSGSEIIGDVKGARIGCNLLLKIVVVLNPIPEIIVEFKGPGFNLCNGFLGGIKG
ncbi:hypothetical protein [Desulfobacter postgatei]|uniref:hypothetical protein n=1 Tax=Desulfobacter postgatei TaxID=2293 RepID=UPI000586A2AE|nr:hypothetical protein [Desulfobacter postgatei]